MITKRKRPSRNDAVGARNLFRRSVECSTGPQTSTVAPSSSRRPLFSDGFLDEMTQPKTPSPQTVRTSQRNKFRAPIAWIRLSNLGNPPRRGKNVKRAVAMFLAFKKARRDLLSTIPSDRAAKRKAAFGSSHNSAKCRAAAGRLDILSANRVRFGDSIAASARQ